MSADYLLYDGECPACRAYVALSQLRRLYPDLQVLDARIEPALVAELRGRGYEINDGMVLSLNGVLHFGAEVTAMLARMGRASSSRWRRLFLWLIGGAPWGRWLYPRLSKGRWLLLRWLERSPIA